MEYFLRPITIVIDLRINEMTHSADEYGSFLYALSDLIGIELPEPEKDRKGKTK